MNAPTIQSPDRRVLPPKRKKSRIQPITFGDYQFDSKTALQKAIQAEVAQYDIAEAFRSNLISDLMVARHPYCSQNHLRPSAFRKFYAQWGRSGYHFQGFFKRIGWKSLAWHKCIDQPTYHDEARKFLRWNLIPILHEARKSCCDRCNARGNLEVNHANPTFQEMYDQVSHLFTDEEIDTWAFYNWDNVPGFRIPPHHPVFKAFMALHENAILETLCKPCHRIATNHRSKRR